MIVFYDLFACRFCINCSRSAIRKQACMALADSQFCFQTKEHSGLCERLRVGELARESEDESKICAKET